MAHNRTESSSTSASTANSASSSLHLPSIDSEDSTHAHDGLFREHMANTISVAHAARLNAQDARVRQRASPVTLRFLRTTPTSSGHGHSAIVGASRIPLPRSTSAPDKLSNVNHDDGVQMASYPTPPLPAHSKTSSTGILELDHPRNPGLVLPEQHARASPASTARNPPRPAALSSPSIPSGQAGPVSSRSPGLPLPLAASSAYTPPQSQPPTPPKRHPLRPVLQSAHLLHARSTVDPPSIPSLASSPSPRFAQSYSFPNTNTTAHSPSVQLATTTSDVLLLTPARTEDDPSSPGSAVYTSAFSSPLDSVSVPRSFLQQQQQSSPTRLQSVTEGTDEAQHLHNHYDTVKDHIERESSKPKHKHSTSDVSEQSIRLSRTGKREDTAEQEILVSITSNTDIPLTPELEISSPGLSSEQGFISSASIRGKDTNLYRSNSVSSSVSSMSSSLTGSEALSSHAHTVPQRVDSRQRRSGDTTSEQESGATSLGHNHSSLDLKNVTATPRQARNVSSSSALDSQSSLTTTPRATASSNQSPTTSSASNKAPLALIHAMETNENSTPPQSSKLSSSLERRRDGTFGISADIKEIDQENNSRSPASIEQTRPSRRECREDSGQSSASALGHLPRSGTTGDVSFSGSPSLADITAISKASQKSQTAGSPSSNGTNVMHQSISSSSLPLGQSRATSGSASASAGSMAQSSSARLLPPSDKTKDGLNKSHSRRPGAVHHSSSKISTSASIPKEVKAPTVPGMEDSKTNTGEAGDSRISWKKKGQEYPKWDVTQPLWYKAPQWGRLPQKGMRAHSATIVPNLPFTGSSSTISPSQTTDMAHLFALDPISGTKSSSLYIFGGCDSKNCFKELFKLDLQSFQWTKPRTLSNHFQPPALGAHSTTYIPPFQSLYSGIYDNLDVKDQFPDDPDIINVRMKSRDGHLLFFGGGDGPNYFNSLYLLNLTSMTWSKPVPPTSPASSNRSTATSQPSIGGKESDPPSNTQHVYGSLPSPRRAHTTVWYEKRKELIVFGGGNGSKALNETWILECKDWKKLTWKKIDALGNKPRVRGYHTMNLLGDRSIVFGGSDGTECFSDVFVLDLDTFTWTEIPIYEPSLHCPRLSHSSTLISPTQILVLGGHNGTDYKKDITIFSLATGKFFNITNTTALECYPTMGPSRRGYHSTCLHDGRILMVGGYDGKKHFDEVWCLEVASIAAFGD